MGKILWTEADEELCKKLLLEGKSYKEIADVLNKDVNAIKRKNYKDFKILKRSDPNELIGQSFGNWRVIEISGIDKHNHILYLCECNCENKTKKNVQRSNLLRGTSTSCGCIRDKKSGERFSKINKRYNNYEEKDDYIIGYTYNNEPFYIDKEDYEKVKNYCWHKHKDGYMRTCLEVVNGKNKYILMHYLLIEKKSIDDEVDHINGNTYDNRKSNLRIVKHINNMKNLKMYKNNTSGYQGVCWNKRDGKWYSYIQVDNERINLGKFTDKNKAIAIRKQAEEKYFGEYNRAKEFKNK